MQKLRHHDFKIGMPDGWVDASNVIMIGPMKEDYSPTMTVTREPLDSPTTARSYATEKRAELEEEFGSQGYEVLEERPIDIGRMSAFQRTHTWMLPEAEIQIQQMQVYFVKEGAALTVTCTDKMDRFDETKPTFMEALKEFEYVEEEAQ